MNVFTSFSANMNKDMKLLAVKLGLDNSILKYLAQKEGMTEIPSIEMEMQGFPRVVDRMINNLDGIRMYGAFYLVMVPLCVFMVLFD